MAAAAGATSGRDWAYGCEATTASAVMSDTSRIRPRGPSERRHRTSNQHRGLVRGSLLVRRPADESNREQKPQDRLHVVPPSAADTERAGILPLRDTAAPNEYRIAA